MYPYLSAFLTEEEILQALDDSDLDIDDADDELQEIVAHNQTIDTEEVQPEEATEEVQPEEAELPSVSIASTSQQRAECCRWKIDKFR